jgi:hypothetical protein
MGWNCYGGSCSSTSRGFLTRKEKISMLEDYKKELEQEATGVGERIKELSQHDD